MAVSSLAASADTSAVHLARGDALFAKHDLDGAIAEYRQALRLKPRDAKAHYELGLALKAKGDLDGAISEYREAIRLEPTLAEAHVNIGSALQVKGDLDGAIAEYREAIRLKPDLALAHANLGSMLRVKRELDESIVELREALRLLRRALHIPHARRTRVTRVATGAGRRPSSRSWLASPGGGLAVFGAVDPIDVVTGSA